MAPSPGSNRTTPNNNNDKDNNSASYFRKTVSLQDWWLIRADTDSQGNSLAVAGFTSREQRPLRMFCSAPITKRYDVFTLETADGITVLLQGFINRIRTTENGFPTEVFSHFLFGFPPYWEECAKKYLGQAVNSGIDLQNTFDFNQSTTVPGVAGTIDSSPTLTPSKHKSVGEGELIIMVANDCSEGVSETFTVDSPKGPDLHNDAANFRNSVEEKSNAYSHSSILNSNLVNVEEPPTCGNKCHPSSLKMPVQNDVDNVKNDALKNLPSLSNCHINAVVSMKDSITVQAEPSGYHVAGSSERIYNLQSSKKSKKRSTGMSETKGLASVESITIKNDASIPEDSNMNNLNATNFDQTLSIGTSHINAVSSMEDSIAEQAEPSEYHVVGSSERIDDSQSCKKSSKRSTRQSKTKGSASLESITIKYDALVPKDSNMDNLNASNFDQTLPIGTSGMTLTVSLDKPKSLNNKQKENEGNKDGFRSQNCHEAVLRCIDENTTYQESLCRSPTVGESNILNASECHPEESMLLSTVQSAAEANVITPPMVERDAMNATPSNSGCRKSSNPSRNLKNNQKQKCVSGCSANHKDKEMISKASEHQDEGNPKRSSRTTVHSPEIVNVSEAMLKAARMMKTLSRGLKSEEKNEQIAVEEGGSLRKNPRRKIFLDTHVSPLTQERTEKMCIRSPESLSLKRSRSGRLLLPSLDFWRNQIPVYDANRNITGIQEELNAVKPSEGSKSANRKKQKRR